MTSRIFKYAIGGYGWTDLDMPVGARVLSFGVQAGNSVIWAAVDPDAPTERRSFVVAYTGGAAPGVVFIGTATIELSPPDSGISSLDRIVLHCFMVA